MYGPVKRKEFNKPGIGRIPSSRDAIVTGGGEGGDGNDSSNSKK